MDERSQLITARDIVQNLAYSPELLEGERDNLYYIAQILDSVLNAWEKRNA